MNITKITKSKRYYRIFSKYPSIGIMEALEKLLFDTNIVQTLRGELYNTLEDLQDEPIDRNKFSKALCTLNQAGFIRYISNDKPIYLTKKGKRKNTMVKNSEI